LASRHLAVSFAADFEVAFFVVVFVVVVAGFTTAAAAGGHLMNLPLASLQAAADAAAGNAIMANAEMRAIGRRIGVSSPKGSA
jgi:hypothetical protein